MMEPNKTKEMSGAEVNVKRKKLRCLRTAEMPNIGLFHEGDIIEDQEKIGLIADNPNFEDATQGE